MGKILIPGGGGGADLDVITANADDVLAPKVIVDQNGEPVAGTLALSGNADPWDVRQGRTFYKTNPKAIQSGTMTERGAAAYTPGNYNQVIGANQFLTGDQTIQGDWNLAPGNIKKGVTIFGVMGSWEGYVPIPTDLYLRGNNVAGFTTSHPTSVIFQSGMIEMISSAQGGDLPAFNTSFDVTMGVPYNFAGYSKFNFEFKMEELAALYQFESELRIGDRRLSYKTQAFHNFNGVLTAYLDIGGMSATAALTLKLGTLHRFYLYRIWLE